MPVTTIRGIPIDFPYEPYDVQKAYMEKVIECLTNSTNGLLESPTGTGKTLSLLCSTLAWITIKKSQFKADIQEMEARNAMSLGSHPSLELPSYMKNMPKEIRDEMYNSKKRPDKNAAPGSSAFGIPKVIYASRTHTQINQAMNELKRCSYSFVRAAVAGSRDQMCIHPDVMKEVGNANKVQMCKAKLDSKSCGFYHRVEKEKDSAEMQHCGIMDIEDLVTMGKKKRFCPYFMSKEMMQTADITFMPYNYILDPIARRANKIELNNTIIILDEAHNVEKMCEESASVELTSSDIALCMADVDSIYKDMDKNQEAWAAETRKDFTQEDMVLLKEMLIKLEEAVNEIVVKNQQEGVTYPGEFIFEILAMANISSANFNVLDALLQQLLQFLATVEMSSFMRRGIGFQKLADLLSIVFASKEDDYMEKVKRSFKCHVEIEDVKKEENKRSSIFQLKGVTSSNPLPKKINYWCFNPGFGMSQLVAKQVRSVIMTSGTLAPLKALISELAIPVDVKLENPHIVDTNQVCVKIVSQGPDKEPLISNYANRDNPKYMNSLGRTILSFTPVIPYGILVFFPSYTLLHKCQDSWQASGIWSQIQRHKPIFVEPRTKDAFATTMNDYYANINDPKVKGAIFMAVCRGKVSEGLDFADINGRAVIITGLPFPPLKDPRVVLKKKYLQDNRTKENELLTGDEWYVLEATRAVNQAIGRVIRHRNDYGAILLCDARFNSPRQINQLSAWVQIHLKKQQQHSNFGPLIGEVSRFFRNAEKNVTLNSTSSLPPPVNKVKFEFDDSDCQVIDHTSPRNQKPNLSKFKYNIKSPKKEFEDANTVTGWTPDDYKGFDAPSFRKKNSEKDFLSRLNGEVSTINFDTIESESSSESYPTVKIHERRPMTKRSDSITDLTGAGGSCSTNGSLSLPRKRKYKLIANDLVDEVGTTVKFERNKIEKVESSVAQTVPEDRKELLTLIKSSISLTSYGLFIKCLTEYQKESQFDKLFAAFLKIFDDPSLHYLLKGMRRFMKDNHKQKFDDNILLYL